MERKLSTHRRYPTHSYTAKLSEPGTWSISQGSLECPPEQNSLQERLDPMPASVYPSIGRGKVDPKNE